MFLFLFYLLVISGVVSILIGIIAIAFVISACKFLKDNKDEIVKAGGKLLKDTISKTNIILKIILKIRFIRKRIEKLIENKAEKAIKHIAIIGISISLISFTSAIGSFAEASSLYSTYMIWQSLPSTILSLFDKKDDNEEVESTEEGWSWDSVADNTLFVDENGDAVTPDDLNHSGAKGNATGKYAVQLDDGSYYWYHQAGQRGNCSCDYCGNWTSADWGAKSFHAFGLDGCAVYSLAIGISNLVGAEVTPTVVLGTLGCTLTDENGLLKVDTSTSSNFTGDRQIIRENAVKTLSAAFGLSYKPIGRTTEEIDEILDRGGYVWGSWEDSKCCWCSNGTRHFMIIRKLDGNNYYCFTSCAGKASTVKGKQGAINTMNYALNKQECINAMVPNQFYGLWTTNVSNGNTSTGGSSSVIGDLSTSQVYQALAADKAYAAKAPAMAAAYEAAAPLYGKEFAIGLMANIVAEGNYGQIEYKNSQGYWSKASSDVLAIAGKIVSSESMVDTLLNGIPDGTKGIGVGSIQWSGGRRVMLLNEYKANAKAYTNDELGVIEVNYMMKELAGGYQTVVQACSGKGASECASIICKNYEKPAHKNSEAVTRANTASDLATKLANIK